MSRITTHPVIDASLGEKSEFLYDGKVIQAEMGFTIAAALHQAGYPVHSHSLKDRKRSLECGIGKCGACEMLVDGEVKRICITQVDGVKEIAEVHKDDTPKVSVYKKHEAIKVFKTDVVIIGAGPAGLAAREVLNEHGVNNIVVDSNDKVGGQFLMQTHQFFFFEKEKKFGGMRGFDITDTLAGDSHDGIMLNSTVWDILKGKRLAVKNVQTSEIFYIDAEHLIVATGAVPFMPAFANDDVPGVYSAAVVQKMMNNELTLLGKNILTIGAGNIGYLTSYQLMQAGGNVKAIVEAMPNEGGFPVQANRVRRLGVPVILSHMLLAAIPNENRDGVVGAVIAECENFKPIPGTEKVIEGIDAINVCTGLVPDYLLLIKGNEIFGRNCHGAGDSVRIGEGTSAVLQGQEAAFKIMEEIGTRFDYNRFLQVSKAYIDSRQHPERMLDEPHMPTPQRAEEKPFVLIDCLYGFACNPCAFSCPFGAITKDSTSSAPDIDFDKCVGCMQCVSQCPGLAMFGYNLKKQMLSLPVEFDVEVGSDVWLVDNDGNQIGEGVIDKVMRKENKTHIAQIKSLDIHGEEMMKVRGFIVKESYPEPVQFSPHEVMESETFLCHCSDVGLEEVLEVIGDRKFISVDEIKHTTRLGMGACRGKRCIKRLKMVLQPKGIDLIGDATPRGPLSNQVGLGELYPHEVRERIIPNISSAKIKKTKVKHLIAGGGIAGSSAFRYLAEAGESPVLINEGRGGTWRNIAGGRPTFSIPELSEIAGKNLEIFKDLQTKKNIDFRDINYVTFAHDQAMYQALEESMKWSDAEMIDPAEFKKHISPFINPNLDKYQAALVTKGCWQATPGKVLDLVRTLGISCGGTVLESLELIDLHQEDGKYICLVRHKDTGEYEEFHAEHFVNALGAEASKFADKLNIETGLFPVRHQAFITRPMPMLGHDGNPLPMIIDRRNYKGFSTVYGQQLAETGQIIGCASPGIDALETGRDVKINSQDFLEIVSETFCDWIPELSSVGYQAIWSGYYVEPRMIIDPSKGLFVGLRGQGFMLGQHLGKLYVDKLLGKDTPDYFDRLALKGDGLLESTFK